jgi:signal transduction histidine kinase
MRKVALVFLIAVIAPSLVLAWMAGRSLRDQAYVSDRQQTLLYQNLVDAQARAVAEQLERAQRGFAYKVESLLKGAAPSEAANRFDAVLRREWPLAEVGFVASLNGQVLAPSPLASAQARQFRVENDRFLCSVESCPVYWNSPKGLINLSGLDLKDSSALSAKEAKEKGGDSFPPVAEDPAAKPGKPERTVAPTKEGSGEAGYSKFMADEVNFRNLVGTENDGAFARFLQDKLHVMFWHRAANDPNLLFGAQIALPRLIQELRPYVDPPADLKGEICLALLDNNGKPVALSLAGFVPSAVRNPWKHPFVAAEIGEVLPHWEMAAYLLDPLKPQRSANSAGLALGLLLGLLVLAIAVGSWLIVADLQRQLTLARQKTDFVSNVSHELKTPLTSIRMFSEMLAEGRVEDDGKRRQFLGIITAEAARLTRLINNVLDFARLERGEKKYRFESCEATEWVRETLESYRPHLEASGFTLRACLPGGTACLRADRDALAQVLVNLLSNAEKYSGDAREIEVQVELRESAVRVRVLDRGLGVPRGQEEMIFEKFHRAHDSLASGIQGSGLGLTLARQIARQHGGDIHYEAREGGGSCFVLELPLAGESSCDSADKPS